MLIRILFLLLPIYLLAEDKNVYAFIGELIEYKKVDYQQYYKLKKKNKTNILEVGDSKFESKIVYNPPVLLDEMYVAKYKIIKPLCNEFTSDTIEFVSFDHYGIPPMFKVKNPIVYLGFNKDKNEYFQYKYTWDDALNINNQWFGVYDYTLRNNLKNYTSISVRFLYAIDIKIHETNPNIYPTTHFEVNANGQSFVTKVFDIYNLAEARIKYINR